MKRLATRRTVRVLDGCICDGRLGGRFSGRFCGRVGGSTLQADVGPTGLPQLNSVLSRLNAAAASFPSSVSSFSPSSLRSSEWLRGSSPMDGGQYHIRSYAASTQARGSESLDWGRAEPGGGAVGGRGGGGQLEPGKPKRSLKAAMAAAVGLLMGGVGVMALRKAREGGDETEEEKKRKEGGVDRAGEKGGTESSHVEDGEATTVSNWSGTHEIQTRKLYQPETEEELVALVAQAHNQKRKIRPVGSALSPNGIGLSVDGMVNLALCDRVLDVDKEKMRVTVQAGARVDKVVEALREHGLTLQNYASIREQQIGGFTQVGAHGTGATLPPVDEQVVSMKLVTPAKGVIELSHEQNPELFKLARCGLGALGVVSEVTLQCVPAHKLLEYTFVSNLKEVKKRHKDWLRNNRHLRYMWIPYTDAVVIVQCNPLTGNSPPKKGWFTRSAKESTLSFDERVAHVRALYEEVTRVTPTATSGKDVASSSLVSSSPPSTTPSPPSDAAIADLSFTELRDKLLAVNPLDPSHVARINKAEAEYWKKNVGSRVGWSDEILGFDCGGQQWVSEVAFPAGSLRSPNMNDISFMEELISLIEKEKIAAPAPLEQRWTAGSASAMSLASSSSSKDRDGDNGHRDDKADTVHSWVGIIMYLPTVDSTQREEITESFFAYKKIVAKTLWDKYGAYEHWAKIEVPKTEEERLELAERLRKRFPVEAFNAARRELDPHKILSNDLIDSLFPALVDNE